MLKLVLGKRLYDKLSLDNNSLMSKKILYQETVHLVASCSASVAEFALLCYNN